MLLQLNKTHHTVAPASSAAIETVGFEVVPHSFYSPDGASFDFWLLAALKKHLEGIHFTCEEEMISRTT
jgi:hypothetical protein